MKVSFLGMISYDGVAPGLEIWPAPSVYCDPAVAASSVERWLKQCELADELGFDWISFSEHHYAPYQMTPNPVVMAAAASQRIKRAKIALLGPLVPLNNPVRLAEELAMLDVISGGRLVTLFLRGTPNEHGTYDTPPAKTREMTQEGIDLILKAWRETHPFSWEGEHYRFSTVSVWPRPLQSPPVVYGSGNSEESIAFAAERGLGVAFSFAPPETVKAWVDLYYDRAAAAGWTPTADHVLYRGLAYVAETDAQAQADTTAHFGAMAMQQAKIQSKTMGGPPIAPLILSPFFLGSAQTVCDRFAVLRDCGVGVVDMVFTIGSHAQQEATLRRFAADVLPVIQSWDAADSARPVASAA